MTASRLRHSAAVAAATGLVAAGLIGAPAQASPGHGHAWGHFKGHCRAVHATGVGTGVGTDGGTGTTTATIYRGQREVGSTVGIFMPGTTVDDVVSFTETITFTDTRGTLVAPVEGTLDTATGEFSSASETVTGTGAYSTVTGKLAFSGVEDLTTLAFTEVVHGKLCVPKKKTH